MIAVMRLVERAGFCLPRIVGTKANTKISWPTEITQSCHCIFPIIFYASGIDKHDKKDI